jgi:hypothetical protein
MIAKPVLSKNPTPELFIRVNDFIQMANRVEQRFDSGHAQVAMAHAFARYSAHHYRSTVKEDSAAEREAYAKYIGDMIGAMVSDHLADVAGKLPGEADAPAGE